MRSTRCRRARVCRVVYRGTARLRICTGCMYSCMHGLHRWWLQGYAKQAGPWLDPGAVHAPLSSRLSPHPSRGVRPSCPPSIYIYYIQYYILYYVAKFIGVTAVGRVRVRVLCPMLLLFNMSNALYRCPRSVSGHFDDRSTNPHTASLRSYILITTSALCTVNSGEG